MGTSNIKIPEGASAALITAEGKIFFGKGIGAKTHLTGEICFNTALTGYQEILTDPSYSSQIITFTFPHIGNVGINEEDYESAKIYANGLIVREDITNPSNFRSTNHLDKWLTEQKIPGICGIDTRAITRYIRDNGAQNVTIYHFGNTKTPDLDAILRKTESKEPMAGTELASKVSTDKKYNWDKNLWKLGEGEGTLTDAKYKVVAIDYGIKYNILRCLAEIGCDVTVVPAKTSAKDILKLTPDGIFLSNGPGDPLATAEYAVPIISELLKSGVPIFGICLGHQLLSRALGASTEKMNKGHRGANQPVKKLDDSKVEITSQNHGFVVTKNIMPDDVVITHLSLFDDTVEGVRSKSKKAFSVQHHPESSPGPHDSFYLFDEFVKLMESVSK